MFYLNENAVMIEKDGKKQILKKNQLDKGVTYNPNCLIRILKIH